MINDPVILRFHFDEGQKAEILPRALATLCAGIESFVMETVAQHTKASVRFSMYFVAAPREGCLEFFFRVEGRGDLSNEELLALVARASRPNLLTTTANAATIVMALWAMVLGGKSLVDMIHPPEKRADTQIACVERETWAAQFAHTETTEKRFAILTNLAIETGTRRVEIQLPDEPSVLIFDASERTHQGIIGRRQRSRTLPHPKIEDVFRRDAREVTVEYRGKRYRAFLGGADVEQPSGGSHTSVSAVILWGSNYPLPQVNEVVKVMATVVNDSTAITPIDAVPTDFDTADWVIFVNQSGRFD